MPQNEVRLNGMNVNGEIVGLSSAESPFGTNHSTRYHPTKEDSDGRVIFGQIDLSIVSIKPAASDGIAIPSRNLRRPKMRPFLLLAILCGLLLGNCSAFHLTEEDFERGRSLNDAELVAERGSAGGPLRAKINVTVDLNQKSVR